MIVGQIISLKQPFFSYVEGDTTYETELALGFPELNETDTYEVMAVRTGCPIDEPVIGATILRCVETNTLYDVDTSDDSFWCFIGDQWPEEYEVVG